MRKLARRLFSSLALLPVLAAAPRAAALEQTWEDPAVRKGRLTCEQLEQALADLGDDRFSVRDRAAKELVARPDLRTLARLMEEMEKSEDAEVRRRARVLLPQVKKNLTDSPYIKDFHILGPFPLTDTERNQVDEPASNDCLYVPTGLDDLATLDLKAAVPLRPQQEQGAPAVKWRRPHPGEHGIPELRAECPDRPEFAHVFLLTFVHSDKAKPATFWLGSDDGLAVWVNGKCVFYGDYHRALAPDSDKALVELQPGWNPVLLRIAQGYGDWGASFRVTDRRGRAWPAKEIDAACGGAPLPVIPAPKQPADAEKAALVPAPLKPEAPAAAGPAEPPPARPGVQILVPNPGAPGGGGQAPFQVHIEFQLED